eukprot:54741_1
MEFVVHPLLLIVINLLFHCHKYHIHHRIQEVVWVVEFVFYKFFFLGVLLAGCVVELLVFDAIAFFIYSANNCDSDTILLLDCDVCGDFVFTNYSIAIFGVVVNYLCV